LSPEPTRGRGGPRIIVRRTIKEATATIQYPTLTRSNYEEWSMLMQVNMEAAGVWYAVEPYEDEEVEYRDDRLALAAILRSVPAEMLPILRGKCSARAAWEAIKTIRVGIERVRESKAQQLRREFAAITGRKGSPPRTSPFASADSRTTFVLSAMTCRTPWSCARCWRSFLNILRLSPSST
jgi:hypothetical protein